jgi:hypothetical protein
MGNKRKACRAWLAATLATIVSMTATSVCSGDPLSVSTGDTVVHPEEITGAWESWIDPVTTVGIDIYLVETVEGAPTTLRGADQKVRFLRVTTYVRHGDQSQRTWWSYDVPARFSWREGHLTLHQTRTANDPYDVDLDLLLDPAKSQWTGRFNSLGISKNVVLKRPQYVPSKSSPVGTWKGGDSPDFECMHIGMGIDGQLVVWSDGLSLTGLVIYGANGTRPPVKTDESYGMLSSDTMLRFGGKRWMFDYGNGLWGEFITGQVGNDGSVFSGEATRYGNGISDGRAHSFAWQRVQGDSCEL